MNDDFERYYADVSQRKPISRDDAYKRWLDSEYAKIKAKSKKKKTRKKKRTPIQNKNWTPDMPCLRCGADGPHNLTFSHTGLRGDAYKATCCKCGKYQKFMSEDQANPYLSRLDSSSQ